MAFMHGEDSEAAEAGAYLIADALISLRSIEGVKVVWKDGPRPGI